MMVMINNNSNGSTLSPKKNLIQRYKEDNQAALEDYVFSSYSQRLVMTWIRSSNPLLSLTPLQRLHMVSNGSEQEQLETPYNMPVHPVHSSVEDLSNYVKALLRQWESVISFFYSQHCKRSRQYCQPSQNLNSDATLIRESHNSLLISCIYYADLFVRRSFQPTLKKIHHYKIPNSISVTEILIVSICVTIKFWMEEKMSVNKYLSEIFSIPVKRINEVEVYCLELIDYSIYLSQKDLKAFYNLIHQCHENQQKQDQQQNKNIKLYNHHLHNSSIPTQSPVNSYHNHQQHHSSFIQAYVKNEQPTITVQAPAAAVSSTTTTPIYSSPPVQYNIMSTMMSAVAPASSSPAAFSPYNTPPSASSTPVSSPLPRSSSHKHHHHHHHIPKTPNNLLSPASHQYLHPANSTSLITPVFNNGKKSLHHHQHHQNSSPSLLIKQKLYIASTNCSLGPTIIKIAAVNHYHSQSVATPSAQQHTRSNNNTNSIKTF